MSSLLTVTDDKRDCELYNYTTHESEDEDPNTKQRSRIKKQDDDFTYGEQFISFYFLRYLMFVKKSIAEGLLMERCRKCSFLKKVSISTK